jgi:hypothetical protein
MRPLRARREAAGRTSAPSSSSVSGRTTAGSESGCASLPGAYVHVDSLLEVSVGCGSLGDEPSRPRLGPAAVASSSCRDTPAVLFSVVVASSARASARGVSLRTRRGGPCAGGWGGQAANRRRVARLLRGAAAAAAAASGERGCGVTATGLVVVKHMGRGAGDGAGAGGRLGTTATISTSGPPLPPPPLLHGGGGGGGSVCAGVHCAGPTESYGHV